MNQFVDGRIVTLDPQDGITGGQYSVTMGDNCLYLIPSVTLTRKGALVTELDMTRKPVAISSSKK